MISARQANGHPFVSSSATKLGKKSEKQRKSVFFFVSHSRRILFLQFAVIRDGLPAHGLHSDVGNSIVPQRNIIGISVSVVARVEGDHGFLFPLRSDFQVHDRSIEHQSLVVGHLGCIGFAKVRQIREHGIVAQFQRVISGERPCTSVLRIHLCDVNLEGFFLQGLFDNLSRVAASGYVLSCGTACASRSYGQCASAEQGQDAKIFQFHSGLFFFDSVLFRGKYTDNMTNAIVPIGRINQK